MAENAQNADWPQNAGESTYSAPAEPKLGDYLSDLKSKLTPEQYAALMKPLMYSANEAYGGQVQDFQAQLITPLDIKKAGFPQQLDMTPARKEMRYGGWDSPDYEVDVPPQLIT
jgi:hypothetical protein